MVLTTNKYSTYIDLLYGKESCRFPTDTNVTNLRLQMQIFKVGKKLAKYTTDFHVTNS